MPMTKSYSILRGVLTLCALTILVPHTVFASGEVIDAFTVHIELQTNSSALVQEEIVYNFGEDAVGKHGIYRNIPKVYTTPDGREHNIEISSVMVTDGQGNLRQTSCEGCQSGGNYMKLKIGEPDVTISGRQLYVIRYTVWGGVNQLRDKDEFYWNVTGNEWKERIINVRADIVLPMPFQESAISAVCYVGYKGSTDRCSASTTPQEGGVVTSVRYTHEGILNTNQGMTIAVGIPKNVFVIAPTSNVKKKNK